MEDQIIAEQIDVIVVGDRKYEFMALMLEREFEFDQQKKKRSHQSYLDLLCKFIPGNVVFKQPSKVISVARSSNGIAKFTKIILTDSFWLHIHFFVQDNKLLDPFLFDANRGDISICIIAASHCVDLTQAKSYLHQRTPQIRGLDYEKITQRDQAALVKPECVIQGKIFSTIHETSVNGFPSVLALKITEQKRIIQQSSNLRLTVNQISRWIVDRHFQNKHKIKIREQLGDQIQNNQEKSQKGICEIW